MQQCNNIIDILSKKTHKTKKIILIFRFGKNVKPICLWQTENIPTDQTIATGWGRLGYGIYYIIFLCAHEIRIFISYCFIEVFQIFRGLFISIFATGFYIHN